MEQSKQRKDMSRIFYGVIGVATLMVAIMGATFAYFTATAGANNALNGNMATVGFNVTVTKMTKYDEAKGGLIPMSNNMVETALVGTDTNSDSKKEICVDNNGNAVCQVYKILVENESSSSMFVDGYVTMSGGSGIPEDIGPSGKGLYTDDAAGTQNGKTYIEKITGKTTMRWAQAFCSTEEGGIVTACTTTNKISNVVYSTLRESAATKVEIAGIGGTDVQASGFNPTEILYRRTDSVSGDADYPEKGVTGTASINGNSYEVIKKNYIRISEHDITNTSYSRVNDTTSALVYNQYLEAVNSDANTGTSITTTFTDAQVYYIVVWLSENGHNQTANADNPANNFFRGDVRFITAQGSEVTATFSGHTRVNPNTVQ